MRDKFRIFKNKGKDLKTNSDQDGEHSDDGSECKSDVQTTLTPETASYDVRSQIDMWNTLKSSDISHDQPIKDNRQRYPQQKTQFRETNKQKSRPSSKVSKKTEQKHSRKSSKISKKSKYDNKGML